MFHGGDGVFWVMCSVWFPPHVVFCIKVKELSFVSSDLSFTVTGVNTYSALFRFRFVNNFENRVLIVICMNSVLAVDSTLVETLTARLQLQFAVTSYLTHSPTRSHLTWPRRTWTCSDLINDLDTLLSAKSIHTDLIYWSVHDSDSLACAVIQTHLACQKLALRICLMWSLCVSQTPSYAVTH